MTKLFIKGSQIIVFVYDITDKNSFNKLEYWVNIVEELLWENSVFGLVANKIDLLTQEKGEKVESNLGKRYANDIGAVFYETSAKEDKKGFQDFINNLIKIYVMNFKKNINEKEKLVLNKNHKSQNAC